MPTSTIPVESLIRQLQHGDWMARCEAARLLGQSRDPRAVEALLPDLKASDWRVRRNAAQALGALRDRRATEPLIQALDDRTATVRQRAVVALGRIKDVQALPALLNIVVEDKRESYEACKAIRKFGKKILPEIAGAYERSSNRKLMALLIEMKYTGAFDLLLALLQNPESLTRLTAVRELGKLGNKKAIPYLIDELQHDDPLLQGEVVRALGKLDAQEAIPALLDLLLDDELYGPHLNLYHAVTEAFQAFGKIEEEIKKAFPGNYPVMFNADGAPISLPEAMGLLGNDSSRLLNNVLSQLQGGTAKMAGLPGLSSNIHKVIEDAAWRFGVMFADAKDAKQERVRRLLELLKAESRLARCAAALTLPWYADERAMEPLRQAAQDSEAMVHRAATWGYQALRKTLFYRGQAGMY